ncbi:MAG: AAA family ATPase, partial [Acidimicrobiales bacterium]|nr:AAA family ATPase [Acidimicrobiales bacterium]
ATDVFAAGTPVVYGRCTERLDLAYQPFVQALRPVDAQIIDSVEPAIQVDTSRTDDAELRQQTLFSAFAKTLARLAAERGAVLVLDDLQWASASTIALLEYLVSVSRPTGVAIVATMRDSSEGIVLPRLLRDIERRGDGHKFELVGLSSDEVHALLAASQLTAGADDAASLVRSTAGNPLLLAELTRAAIQAGSNSIHLDAASGADLPSSIAQLVEDRIGRLSHPLEVLEIAATIGVDFELPVLADAVGPDVDPLLALEEASVAKLVAELGGGIWQFRHAITRQVLLEAIGPSRQIRYHRRIADALTANYGPDDVLHLGRRAHHLCRAAQPGSTTEAVQAALAAASARLEQLDSGEALQHVTDGLTALALDPNASPATEAELHLLAAHTHLHRFDHPSRLDAAFKAEQCARRCDSGRLLAQAALIRTAFWTQGTLDDHTVPLLLEALDALGDTETELRSELVANLSGWAGVAGAAMTDEVRKLLTGDAVELAAQAVDLAQEAQSPTCEVAALGALFVAKWCGPFVDEQLAIADQIDAVDHPSAEIMALRWRLAPLMIIGDRAGLRSGAKQLLDRATDIRSRHLQAFALQCEAADALLDARFEDASALGAAAVERARNHANFELVYQSQLFWIAYERNELPLLLPFVAAAAAEHDSNLPAFQAMHAVSLSRCDQPDAAHQIVADLAQNDFDDLSTDILWVATMMGVADTVAELGAVEYAPALRRHLAPYGGQLAVIAGGGFVYAAIDRMRAIAAAMEGDVDEAAELFGAAIVAESRIESAALSLRTRYWRARMLETDADDPVVLRRAAKALGLHGLVHDLDGLLQRR